MEVAAAQATRPPAEQPQPIRVAFISGLHVGGAERCFIQLAAHFRAAKAVAWIVPYKGDTPLREEAARHCDIFEAGDDETPPELVARAVEQSGADVVIAWGSPNLEPLTRGLTVPVIDLCQNSPQWRVMAGAKTTATKGAHYFAAVTAASASAYPPEVRPHVRIIPNAVEPNRATPRLTRQEARRAWNIGETDKLLAYVARFTAEKNPAALLDALQRLPADYKLLAVGPKSEHRAEWKARAAEFAPGRVFTLHDTTTVNDVLQAADAFVLPSHSEGLPLSMLEAMFAGVPCVVTRWDCMAELEAEHGPLAWTVERGAGGPELAAAIEQSQAEGGRYANRVGLARSVVFENYTATRVATLWERFLADVLRDWLELATWPALSVIGRLPDPKPTPDPDPEGYGE